MRKLFLLSLVVGFALPCLAADGGWNGSWKLNEGKSKLTGRTLTFAKEGDMYALDEGTVQFKFACDGKDYPVIANRTITCTQSGNVYTTTAKADGKVLSTTTHTIAPDSNTITETTTGTRPDGTAFKDTSTSRRVGGGQGLVGTWKEVKVKSSVPEMMILQVSGDRMRFEDPAYKEVSETKLDGTPGPITGGSVPPGMLYTSTSEGPNKVLGTVMLNGKVLGKQEMTLSPDGKTITDVHWQPGKETEKTMYIYEKQ